ncbi:helix-turn-helix transcriptional regulator [Pseudooceanicola nanhaiensis]|uniref:helix-turn-helix transcriptional regulator n=1 Tax=Pseudooceanicola nanhaiensis TaxID=375761 RepID=UPI001CD2D03D|nr:helix-turn-helix domain-containing protein [Pseudooceanicola nanhaiensis]MCA0919745.1 helix-turn-helix transcriptional regulator [Pseudooceanicola nanhaiensis]
MTDPAAPSLISLAQLSRGGPWRTELQHSREDHLFLWITRGQGRVLVMGRRRGLGPHNALLLPARTLMSLDLGKQVYGLAVRIPGGSVPFLPTQEALHLRVRDVLVQGEATAILDAMQREQSTHRPFGAEAARAHAGLLSVWIRRVQAQEPPAPQPNAAQRLAEAFCSLVARDYRSGAPMAAYATALGVTPTHLTRTLRQTSGMTAADILTERVLHGAREMLQDGDLPIRMVAESLGFSSAAYFTRFIQHHTKQTPSALRKQAHAAPLSAQPVRA